LYFTMGGRGTQGDVYRIVYTEAKPPPPAAGFQRLSPWDRAKTERTVNNWLRQDKRENVIKGMVDLATNASGKAPQRGRFFALDILQRHFGPVDRKLLESLLEDKDADIRAHAIGLLGLNGYKDARPALVKALKDRDAMVRRRACEALIRAGI